MHTYLKPAKTCSDSSADNEAWNHKKIQNWTEFWTESSIFCSTASEIAPQKQRLQRKPKSLNYAPPSQSNTMIG